MKISISVKGMTGCSPIQKIRIALCLMTVPVLILSIFTGIGDNAYGAVSEGVSKGVDTDPYVDLHFFEAGRDPSLSIRLPGSGEILQTSLNVGTVPECDRPDRIIIDIGLDNRFEWEFGGGREGKFGEQDSFIDGTRSRTELADGSHFGLSFYLPKGAIVKDAFINVSSPPSPEAKCSVELFISGQNDFDLDAVDTADLDGDGNLEFIYFDEDDGKVYAEGITGNGSTFKTSLLSDVWSPVHLRAIGRKVDHPSMVVISRPADPDRQEIVALVGNATSDMKMEMISDDLYPGASGFSMIPGSIPPTILALNGRGGGLMSYELASDGTLKTSVLADRSIKASSLVSADVDGDGDRDIVLLPHNGDGDNITIMEYMSSSTPPIYVSMDTGVKWCTGDIGTSIDINGNGKEEIVIITGNGSVPALLYMNDDDELAMEWIGFNHTRSTPRLLKGSTFGGVVNSNGSKDMLYLSTFNGLYHLLPGSDGPGDLIWRRSHSFDSMPLAPQDVDPDRMISLRRDLSFIQHEIFWATAGEMVMSCSSGGDEMDLDIPFGKSASVGIKPLIIDGPDLPVTTNSFGTYLERYDLDLGGNGGFIQFGDLMVNYDVDLEISNAPGIKDSMKQALEIESFTGDWIPFSVAVTSRGSVRIGPVSVEYDSPPVVAKTLPIMITAPEGSSGMTHFNVRDHISDDYLLSRGLDVSLVMMNGPDDIVFMDRNGNIVTQAFKYPDLFGDLEFFFRISDLRTTVVSDPVVLDITPVQDNPRVVGVPGLILLDEDESSHIPLDGRTGVFYDPDGDPMQFRFELIDPYPIELVETLNVEIVEGTLKIVPSPEGVGGELKIMLYARDSGSGWERAARAIMAVKIQDVDAPPVIGTNPGKIYLLEDQSTPSRIRLDGWLMDPDTRMEGYELIFHTSSPYIDVYGSNYKGEMHLFITPMNDLVGEHFILVEMTDGNRSIMDRLDLEIEPVNDVPEIEFDGKELLGNRGWLITGHVTDPDSNEGMVEYRIGNGEWTKAWGFKIWSKVIDFKDTIEDTSFVFFRASDGHEVSSVEYIKLERPEVIPPPIRKDPPIKDKDPIGDGSDPTTDGAGLVPDPSKETGPPWMLMGGILGLLVSLVVFFVWTEIGMVIVATIGGSIYSKLSKKDILNHEIRGLIRGYIIANPGDHYSSIKRNLDLNNGTLAYHLRVLEQNDFIKSMYDGIYKRYYPSNVNISKLKKNVSKQEEIFNVVLENPGVTMEQVGRMIGVSRQVVNYHVKNLIRAGVINYRRDNRSATFYPSDNGSTIHDQQT
ncbi:MAG: winged helix-turn-helix transcriptional regulator [Candidatus Thermoplasmatota archaeon]|nr:winged helix-turn-helix transcriptional regulator [Candidatus Thermoplasmatota archaeon]